MDRRWWRVAGGSLFPLILIVLLVWLASKTLLPNRDEPQAIAYSELIARVRERPESVRSVVFIPKTQRIEATLADGRVVRTHYPTDPSQAEFQRTLEREGIRFDSKGSGDSAWWNILTYLLPFLLFFGFWIFLLSQVQGGRRPGGLWRRSEVDERELEADPELREAYRRFREAEEHLERVRARKRA